MSTNIGQILVTKNIISQSQLDAALARKNQDPEKYLGQILCEMGVSQSKIIKALYYSNKRKKIGQILVDMNVISANQLQIVLEEQKRLQKNRIRKPIGTLLVEKRIIDEDSYVNALSVHFSMPVISLKGYVASESLQKAIGEKYAMEQRIVVLENGPTRIIAAIAEPSLFVFEEIERGLPPGKKLMFCVAKASEIAYCLKMKEDPYSNARYR